jgi:hypothetical protein
MFGWNKFFWCQCCNGSYCYKKLILNISFWFPMVQRKLLQQMFWYVSWMSYSLLVLTWFPLFIAILFNSWGQQGGAANLFKARSTSFKMVTFQNNSAEQVGPKKYCFWNMCEWWSTTSCDTFCDNSWFNWSYGLIVYVLLIFLFQWM